MACRSMSSGRTAEPPPLGAPAPRPRTLVVGLGNPTRGDDGVGWRVIDALRVGLATAEGDLSGDVETDQLAVGGLTLMEQLVGYERAILVDAISTGRVPPGTVTCLPLSELETRLTGHLDSSHDAGVLAALEAGRALGAPLPDEITAVAVEARILDDFDEELSQEVAAAVPHAVATVLRLLEER